MSISINPEGIRTGRVSTKAKSVVPQKGKPGEPTNKTQHSEPRKAKRGGVEGDKNVAPKSKLRLVKTTAPTVKAPRVKKAKEPVAKSFDAAPNVIALASHSPQKSTLSAAVANKGVQISFRTPGSLGRVFRSVASGADAIAAFKALPDGTRGYLTAPDSRAEKLASAFGKTAVGRGPQQLFERYRPKAVRPVGHLEQIGLRIL